MSNIGDLLNQVNSSTQFLEIEPKLIGCVEQVRDTKNDGFTDESIDELAQSIQASGLTNPITVRLNKDFKENQPLSDTNRKYIVVCGERRFTACKKIGLKVIPCVVKEFTSDKDIEICQLTENIQRVDLDTHEIAASFIKLRNNGMSVNEIAEKWGKKPSDVTLLLAFEDLSPAILDWYSSGKISHSARFIYNLNNLYKKNSELVTEWCNDYFDTNPHDVLTQASIAKIKEYIKSNNPENNDNIGEPFVISVQNPTNSSEPSTEVEEDDQTEQDNSTEYVESEGREHSEKPTMAPKHQEDNSPTAGINATSSYTDKDTKVEHDLSDSIKEQSDTPAPDSYNGYFSDETLSIDESSEKLKTFDMLAIHFSDYQPTQIKVFYDRTKDKVMTYYNAELDKMDSIEPPSSGEYILMDVYFPFHKDDPFYAVVIGNPNTNEAYQVPVHAVSILGTCTEADYDILKIEKIKK